jgi:hypothetical protein
LSSHTTHNRETTIIAGITDPWNSKEAIKSRIHPSTMERITMASNRALKNLFGSQTSPPRTPTQQKHEEKEKAEVCQNMMMRLLN